MTTRGKRFIAAIGALAIAIVLGVVAYQMLSDSGAPAAPREVSVDVSRPTLDTVFEAVRYIGTVEGAGDALLSFGASGELARVHVVEGQAVAAGTPLATLDNPDAAARIDRARSELARAEANLRHWERELGVDERLLAHGAIPRAQRDQTALSRDNASLTRDAAAAGVREAEALGNLTRLQAPHAGRVAAIERARGEFVGPGQPVIRLRAGAPRVRVDVLERDAGEGIGPGTRAVVTTRSCGDVVGKVTESQPAVRAPLQSVRVYVEADRSCLDELPTGADVPVTFHVRPDTAATLVPVSALDLRGGTPRVFRVDEASVVVAVAVELGVQRGALQQIRGPIRPDDRIVTSGASGLRAGDRVQVRGEPRNATMEERP
jgi:RND family efflux transporter MFP subunit